MNRDFSSEIVQKLDEILGHLQSLLSQREQEARANQAYIRLYIDDLREFIIRVDGREMMRINAEKSKISPYLAVPAGKRRIEISDVDYPEFPMYSKEISLPADTYWSLVSVSAQQDILQEIFRDVPRAAKPNFANLQIINASFSNFDVLVPNGKLLAGHLQPGKQSPLLQVTPGIRELHLRWPGNPGIHRMHNLNFEAGASYTLFLRKRNPMYGPALVTTYLVPNQLGKVLIHEQLVTKLHE